MNGSEREAGAGQGPEVRMVRWQLARRTRWRPRGESALATWSDPEKKKKKQTMARQVGEYEITQALNRVC